MPLPVIRMARARVSSGRLMVTFLVGSATLYSYPYGRAWSNGWSAASVDGLELADEHGGDVRIARDHQLDALRTGRVRRVGARGADRLDGSS